MSSRASAWTSCCWAASVVVAGGAALAGGCGALTGIDDLVADRVEGSSGGAGGDGAASGSTGNAGSTGAEMCGAVCGTPGCGACPAVTMIEVPSADGPYRIDALEVTTADYDAFLATRPSLALAPSAACAWNDSFVPGAVTESAVDVAIAAGVPYVDPAAACAEWKQFEAGPDRPVACVDWCDANAFCAWAGKRLCGRVGSGGIYEVPNGGGPQADDAISEWMGACDGASDTLFPYGNTYEPGRCNDGMSGNKAVGSFTACEGGSTGVFDMSGNVGEWDAGCTDYDNPPALQNCLARGGTWYQSGAALQCGAFRDVPRFALDAWLGFRCCADP